MGLTHEQRELIRFMRSGARRAELANEIKQRRQRGQKAKAAKRSEEPEQHEDMPGSWLMKPSQHRWHTKPHIYSADKDYFGSWDQGE